MNIEQSVDDPLDVIASIHDQATSGDIWGAKQAAYLIPSQKVRAIALLYVAEALVGLGDIQAAKEILLQISEATDTSSVLSRVSHAQADLGDFSSARETATEISEASHACDAFMHIAFMQKEMGKIDDAASALLEAIQIVVAKASGIHRDTLLQRISVSQATLGYMVSSTETISMIGDSSARRDAMDVIESSIFF